MKARTLQGIRTKSGEVEEKQKKKKKCPESCDDGTVKISTSSGQTRKIACPIISSDCPHGGKMEQALDRYIAGIMLEIGVPRRFLKDLMKHVPTSVAAAIAKWITYKFLIITGDAGSVKSFCAALSVREYLKNLVTDRFDRRAWEIAERAGNSMVWCSAMEISIEREIAERANHSYLTVIDNLGEELDSRTAQAVLSGIILKRHDMELPTVIATDLTLLDIPMRYGDKIADRLIEDTEKRSVIVECRDTPLLNFSELPLTDERKRS
jgi:hypothetical protein